LIIRREQWAVVGAGGGQRFNERKFIGETKGYTRQNYGSKLTKNNESRFIVQVIIQHCKAVQPHRANSWLAKSPLRFQTAYRGVNGLGKSSQQKQTAQIWVTLIVKFDIVFMKVCV